MTDGTGDTFIERLGEGVGVSVRGWIIYPLFRKWILRLPYPLHEASLNNLLQNETFRFPPFPLCGMDVKILKRAFLARLYPALGQLLCSVDFFENFFVRPVAWFKRVSDEATDESTRHTTNLGFLQRFIFHLEREPDFVPDSATFMEHLSLWTGTGAGFSLTSKDGATLTAIEPNNFATLFPEWATRLPYPLNQRAYDELCLLTAKDPTALPSEFEKTHFKPKHLLKWYPVFDPEVDDRK